MYFASITCTIVDATPISLGPPSIKQSTLPSNSLIISPKLVTLGFPEILLLVVAIGNSAYCINLSAISFAGRRIPTVSRFAVTILGTISFFFKIIVKGPGHHVSRFEQNLSIFHHLFLFC